MTVVPSKHNAVVFTGEKEDGKLVTTTQVETCIPGPNDLLVKTIANGLNPTDWKHICFEWGEKGNVVGSDAAGVVVAKGSDVTGFEIGDCVSVFTHGGYAVIPLSGSFQEYFIADPYLTINYGKDALTSDTSAVAPGKITTYEGAASLTLGLVTVGYTFYYHFKVSFEKAQQANKAVVIWGGATATGMIAIQVAKKVFGLEVIAVASKKHEERLISFGADKVFDYHDEDVVQQIRAYGGERAVFGFDTVSEKESINPLYESLAQEAPVILDNLLRLDESVITNKRSNVTMTWSLAYLARGEDQFLSGFRVEAHPGIKEVHEEFWNNIQKFVLDGTIQHGPLKLLPNGFQSVEEGLSLLRNGKVSGEKLIIRTADSTF